jgi:hypothetical protein
MAEACVVTDVDHQGDDRETCGEQAQGESRHCRQTYGMR